ncbi:hypothetical protein D0U04_13785 [Bacillus clarus]|uniref:Uncharacterized protein n=1 Tax=Bacillus clarus TaxID=2338372 RepID=A0A090YSH2_9BACI|nr:hypothetical protein [Bacillus clarus]KFN01182.1 hypothetical protein DJ93_360 [Bacillus clarus]RFT66513.1 hypothetical protein D0U04_13785 [Bacillus clarus]
MGKEEQRNWFNEVATRGRNKHFVDKYFETMEEDYNKKLKDREIQDKLKDIIQYCKQQDNNEVKEFANSIVEKIKPLIKTK